MLRRRYPDREKNVDNESTRKCIRLSPKAEQVLEQLAEAMVAKWPADQLPSISMMISKALVFYADRITYDPRKLEAAYAEFVEESKTREQEQQEGK